MLKLPEDCPGKVHGEKEYTGKSRGCYLKNLQNVMEAFKRILWKIS